MANTAEYGGINEQLLREENQRLRRQLQEAQGEVERLQQYQSGIHFKVREGVVGEMQSLAVAHEQLQTRLAAVEGALREIASEGNKMAADYKRDGNMSIAIICSGFAVTAESALTTPATPECPECERLREALERSCERLSAYVECPGQAGEKIGDYCDEDDCMNGIEAKCWAEHFKLQAKNGGDNSDSK